MFKKKKKNNKKTKKVGGENRLSVRECYEKMGGNYDGVLSRLGNEMLIRKFVIKFLKDPSFQDPPAAIEKSDAESAFRAAHTLKGICLNLGFDNLYKPSEALTEKLRGGELNGYETLYDEVKEQYDKTVEAINEIAE